MHLPNEKQVTADIKARLGVGIDLVNQLLCQCVHIIHEGTATADLGITPASNRVAMGLAIRSCKLLRQAVVAAEIGGEESIKMLSRSLFETALATRFVLTPSLSIPFGKETVAVSTEKRAHCYLAYQSISTWDKFQSHASSKNSGITLSHPNASVMRKNAATMSSLVGQDWVDRFNKHPRTYSGVSIKKLAELLGPEFQTYYRTVYGMDSEVTHATDISNHVGFDGDDIFIAKWHPPMIVIHRSLATCAVQCCTVFRDLQERFQFKDFDPNLLVGIVATINEMFD